MLDKDTDDHRLTALEKKVDTLATDTSALLEMWKDASVVFKWLRKLGAGFIWISQVIIAIGAVYGITSFWNNRP